MKMVPFQRDEYNNLKKPEILPPTNHHSGQKLNFCSFYDFETLFQPQEADGAEGYTQKMAPAMALCTTLCLAPPHPNDHKDIAELKTKEFPTKICYGPQCVEEMLDIVYSHAKEVKRRTDLIYSHYDKAKLRPSEEARYQNIERCEM